MSVTILRANGRAIVGTRSTSRAITLTIGDRAKGGNRVSILVVNGRFARKFLCAGEAFRRAISDLRAIRFCFLSFCNEGRGTFTATPRTSGVVNIRFVQWQVVGRGNFYFRRFQVCNRFTRSETKGIRSYDEKYCLFLLNSRDPRFLLIRDNIFCRSSTVSSAKVSKGSFPSSGVSATFLAIKSWLLEG